MNALFSEWNSTGKIQMQLTKIEYKQEWDKRFNDAIEKLASG